MAENLTTPNRWLEFYEFQDNQTKKRIIEDVCRVTGISSSTFYTRRHQPWQYSVAEKRAIAFAVRVPAHFLFPELEESTAPAGAAPSNSTIR